jgi:hypothetical protein
VSIGSIFLTELYLATNDSRYKNLVQNCIGRLEDAIEPSGGYAHGPHQYNLLGYLELVIMSNMALMAMGLGDKCGCPADQSIINAAADYVDLCTDSLGGVKYSHVTAYPRAYRTGSSIMAIHLAGVSSGKQASRISFLKYNASDITEGHGSACMAYLGGGMGCMVIGQGTWDSFVSAFFQRILDHCDVDGSIKNFDGDGKSYGDYNSYAGPYYRTGVYALLLQLDLGHLRILR